jgi:O-antigen ligase
MMVGLTEQAANPAALPALEAAFDHQEAHSRWRKLGWLYVAMGAVWAAASVGPMSAAELAGVPLAVAFVVSLDIVRPVLRWWVRQPLVWVLVAWAAWVGASLLWTPDRAKGGWELASLRFVYPLLVAWPLMRHRRLLVYALAVGFLLTNASQVLLWLGHSMGVEWLQFKAPHPRNAGWWAHPAVCGYMFVAALGLHLPAAMMGRGRARWFAALGCVATIAGMIATGTRGAWIASVALIVVVAGVAVVTRRWSVRSGVIGAAVVGVLAVGVWFVAGEKIVERGTAGLAEIRAALVEGKYETDTGGRIKFAKWAWEMGTERPVWGHGAGSYEHWVQARLAREGRVDAGVKVAPQAHNLWLHVFATLGLVGVVIAGAVAWVATRGAFRGVGGGGGAGGGGGGWRRGGRSAG